MLRFQIATGQYEWHVYRAAVMMRGSIASLIYHKSLRLDVMSDDVSPEGALTLMSTDCETIAQGIFFFHELWGGVVEICVGLYLIYRELGAACAIPISVVFGGCLPIFLRHSEFLCCRELMH